MKTIYFSIFMLLAFVSSAFCQEPTPQSSEMLDMKLQLLNSKLDLLDTKIKLWESKPKELDLRLSELDSKIKQIDFDPAEVLKRLNELDSIVKLLPDRPVAGTPEQQIIQRSEPVEASFNPSYNSAIMLDPARLPEGTFSLSYERIIDHRFSVNLTGMATYSTERGISNRYFSNQKFSMYNSALDRYDSYDGEVMSGGGFNLQFRNYLLANHPGKRTAPFGLYAAPQFMYRLMKIKGYYSTYEPETNQYENYEMVKNEVHQHLRILAGGVILGIKIPVMKVLAVDFFAGGNIRLAKYKDEDGFT
ncbi:MAG TPA: hypothetical protein VHO46_16175, partial [Bacteroidales bacterium]|nr:hypothetical protein [Bacteroidales bacterium]